MSRDREIGIPSWSDTRQMWRLSVQRNGDRKWFTSKRPGRTGRRIVEEKAFAWLDELDQDESESPLVKDAYQNWLEETREMTGPASYRSQESIGRNYILPLIGDMRTSELTTEQPFQNIINYAYMHSAQGRERLSHQTLQNIRAVMTGFLRYCRKNGWTQLRLEFLTIPKTSKRPDKRTLQPCELQILFASDETVLGRPRGTLGPDPLIHMYRFHVLTGMRPGEVIGLQWDDIDGDVVRVQRSINYHGEITPGKNTNARRAFIMPQRARDEIEAQRTLLAESRIESAYVFPDAHGNAMTHRQYRRRLHVYCSHNGIELTTPYELRHTWYSINKALPTELVKQMGGHSEAMDTFGVYGHQLDGESGKFAQMLDGVLDDLLGSP